MLQHIQKAIDILGRELRFAIFVSQMLTTGLLHGLRTNIILYGIWTLTVIFLITIDFGIYSILLFIALYAVYLVRSFLSTNYIELTKNVNTLETIPKTGPSSHLLVSKDIAFQLYGPHASDLSQPFEMAMFTTINFLVATYLWFHHDPTILAGAENSLGSVALFIVDLFLRGGFFDLMEHFNLQLGKLKINELQSWYSWCAFSYRLYVPLFLFATIFRAATLLRTLRSHIARITDE